MSKAPGKKREDPGKGPRRASGTAAGSAIPALEHSRRWIWVSLGLVIAGIVIYHPIIGYPFIDLDDDAYFVKNSMVRAGLTWSGIQRAFTTIEAANWHPLTWLSLMLDATLFGTGPAGPHAVNLALHLINTLLVFTLFRRLTSSFWPGALVAALFCVHPMHVESVAWVSERKDVLSSLFGLSSMIAYVRYAREGGTGRYLVALGLFALGLLAKPMLVTLPLVLLLLDLWPLERLRGAHPKAVVDTRALGRLILEKTPFLLMSLASSVVTVYAQSKGGAVQALENVTLLFRVETALTAYAAYIGKALLPMDLCIYYPLPVHGHSVGRVIFSALLLAGITWWVVRSIKARPYLAVGWLWFLGTMVPVIGLVQVGQQAMADRYAYIPFLGLYTMLAWGSAELVRRFRSINNIMRGAWIALLCLFTLMASRQVRLWKDGETLFGHALEVTQDNTMMEGLYGLLLGRQGRHDEAMQHLSRAIQLWPQFFDALYHMAESLVAIGRPDDALEYYSKALAVSPDVPAVHLNMGSTLAMVGEYDEAMRHLMIALKADTASSAVHTNIGLVYLYEHDVPHAMDHLVKAVDLDPKSVDAQNNLGLALLLTQRYDEALGRFEEALRLDPKFAKAKQNIARTRRAMSEPTPSNGPGG